MPDAHLDQILLKSLREIFRDLNNGRDVLIVVPDDDFDKHPTYPAPMVYLNDLPFNHPHSLKRCMARLFSHPYAGSFERDLIDVMQVTLPGFFHIPGCRVLRYCLSTVSSLQTEFLWAFSNPPSPPRHPAISVPQFHESIECRLPIAGVPACMWLPLLVAIPWDGRPREEGAAELAKRFEWSLAFIVHLHSLVRPGEGLPQMCSLLGVLYTPRGIEVYAHYARESEHDSEWHYVSVLLSTYFADSFMRPNPFDIADVVAVLLLLQRHASEVQRIVSSWLDR